MYQSKIITKRDAELFQNCTGIDLDYFTSNFEIENFGVALGADKYGYKETIEVVLLDKELETSMNFSNIYWKSWRYLKAIGYKIDKGTHSYEDSCSGWHGIFWASRYVSKKEIKYIDFLTRDRGAEQRIGTRT